MAASAERGCDVIPLYPARAAIAVGMEAVTYTQLLVGLCLLQLQFLFQLLQFFRAFVPSVTLKILLCCSDTYQLPLATFLHHLLSVSGFCMHIYLLE